MISFGAKILQGKYHVKAWENMLENIEMHHQTNPAQSPTRLDGIRVICGCDKSVQTSSDVSAQLLIALTCFKKNFYCRVIMGGGYWWSINQAVDTLINRYIIEFGRLESWSKPNSKLYSTSSLWGLWKYNREPIQHTFYGCDGDFSMMSWPNIQLVVFTWLSAFLLSS